MINLRRPITDFLPRAKPIGFGCAYLTGGFEENRNIRLVHSVLDCGISHFDIAPLYGIGTAENVLGKAISGRRGSVTIATKIGRPRPILTYRAQMLRLLASPLRTYASNFLRKKEVSVVRGAVSRGQFDVSFVRDSLHDSLRRLNTDYVDILFLHEVMAEDITDELLTFLDKCKAEGLCASSGLATTHDKLEDIARVLRDFPIDIVQYSWSALDLNQRRIYNQSAHITHRALMRAYIPMLDWFKSSRDIAERISNACSLDLSNPSNLSKVLLGAALHNNSGGMVLVSSRNSERVKENAKVLQENLFVNAGAALIKALKSEKSLPAILG
jgi:aryl-alcohol dehydrogenase-like predicted oxidoreductase